MDDKLISEKYLTEIAFTKEYDPIGDTKPVKDGDPSETFYIIFWMADNFFDTLQRFIAKDIETAVDVIILGNENITDKVLAKLKSKPNTLFYAVERQEDSNDLTLIVVGNNPYHTEHASIALNKVYEEDKDMFFKILKVEGMRVR